jgi:hypothetical protein
MTPEEMAKAVATGKAPCGCHRVVENDGLTVSTGHDENCLLLVKAEEKKAKK